MTITSCFIPTSCLMAARSTSDSMTVITKKSVLPLTLPRASAPLTPMLCFWDWDGVVMTEPSLRMILVSCSLPLAIGMTSVVSFPPRRVSPTKSPLPLPPRGDAPTVRRNHHRGESSSCDLVPARGHVDDVGRRDSPGVVEEPRDIPGDQADGPERMRAHRRRGHRVDHPRKPLGRNSEERGVRAHLQSEEGRVRVDHLGVDPDECPVHEGECHLDFAPLGDPFRVRPSDL